MFEVVTGVLGFWFLGTDVSGIFEWLEAEGEFRFPASVKDILGNYAKTKGSATMKEIENTSLKNVREEIVTVFFLGYAQVLIRNWKCVV